MTSRRRRVGGGGGAQSDEGHKRYVTFRNLRGE